LESGVMVLVHNDLGTTPNIAPPSSLKFPVLIGYIFIAVEFEIKIRIFVITECNARS